MRAWVLSKLIKWTEVTSIVLTFFMQHITFPSLRRVIAPTLLTCIFTILFVVTLSGCTETNPSDSAKSEKTMVENRFFGKPLLADESLVADPGVLLLLVPEGQVLSFFSVL